MTQENETALVAKTADALIKILSREEILPWWESVLDEVRAGMEEAEAVQAVEDSKAMRDREPFSWTR